MLCVCVCVVWDTGPGPELSGPGLPAASLRHLSEASILLATRDKTDRLQVRAHTPPHTLLLLLLPIIHIFSMSTYISGLLPPAGRVGKESAAKREVST